VGPGDQVYREPLHPYTRALLDSIPSTDPTVARAAKTIKGELPSPIHPPSGCRFRTRCPRAAQRCAAEEPRMRELAAGHTVACHFPLADAPANGEGARGEGAGNEGAVPAASTTARSEEKIGETPR
jgi:oligopeptide transport system ATP-binding protein